MVPCHSIWRRSNSCQYDRSLHYKCLTTQLDWSTTNPYIWWNLGVYIGVFYEVLRILGVILHLKGKNANIFHRFTPRFVVDEERPIVIHSLHRFQIAALRDHYAAWPASKTNEIRRALHRQRLTAYIFQDKYSAKLASSHAKFKTSQL